MSLQQWWKNVWNPDRARIEDALHRLALEHQKTNRALESITASLSQITKSRIPTPCVFKVSGNAGTPKGRVGTINVLRADGTLLATTTDDDGNFSFSVPPGNYKVTPVLVGEYFVPPFREIEVVGYDVTHVDFVDPAITNR